MSFEQIIGLYTEYWKRYADFEGKTDRPGYWWVFLCNFVISSVLSILGIRLLISLFSLATLVPGLAICVRRLRDAGYKWTWIFISLVPVVGVFILIYMLCKPSANSKIIEAGN